MHIYLIVYFVCVFVYISKLLCNEASPLSLFGDHLSKTSYNHNSPAQINSLTIFNQEYTLSPPVVYSQFVVLSHWLVHCSPQQMLGSWLYWGGQHQSPCCWTLEAARTVKWSCTGPPDQPAHEQLMRVHLLLQTSQDHSLLPVQPMNGSRTVELCVFSRVQDACVDITQRLISFPKRLQTIINNWSSTTSERNAQKKHKSFNVYTPTYMHTHTCKTHTHTQMHIYSHTHRTHSL